MFLPKCSNNQIFGMAKWVPNQFHMPKPVFFVLFGKKSSCPDRRCFQNLVSTPIFVPNAQIHPFWAGDFSYLSIMADTRMAQVSCVEVILLPPCNTF
jgi:hypothetical protein